MFTTRQAASLLASCIFSRLAASQHVVSLVGDDWTLSNPELNVSVPAQLPSVAHLDLYDNQVIGVRYTEEILACSQAILKLRSTL